MRRDLTQEEVDRLLGFMEDYNDYNTINEHHWEITDDKIFDPIRSESDDKEFPYIVLVDGIFYEALSEYGFRCLKGEDK